MIWELLEDCIGSFEALLVLLQLVLSLAGNESANFVLTGSRGTDQKLLEEPILLVRELTMLWDLRHPLRTRSTDPL